jgi:hypothetical protein
MPHPFGKSHETARRLPMNLLVVMTSQAAAVSHPEPEQRLPRCGGDNRGEPFRETADRRDRLSSGHCLPDGSETAEYIQGEE